MGRQHGPWTITSSRERFANEFITVCEDEVIQPDGAASSYATVAMKPGVAVLAWDADDSVYLIKQFRYAIGRDSIEVVSGGMDGGEDPEAAARRELAEELGATAARWQPMGTLDPDTSIVRCPVALFVARDLSFAQPDREGSEVLKPLRMPMAEAVRMAVAGEITHGPSCALLLKARAAAARG